MSATDIAGILEDQKTLTAAIADAAKLRKDAGYHERQAVRKNTEAVKLETEASVLQTKLDALTGTKPADKKVKA